MRLVALIAALILPVSAMALEVPSLPAGMCALDTSTDAGKLAHDYLTQANQGSNRIVAVFARCDEAKKPDVLLHYGTVAEQELPGDVNLSREDYLQTASQMVALNSALTSQATSQAFGAATDAAKANSISAQQLTASGSTVLLNGKDVLVIGMKQSHLVDGKPMQVASTAGMTLIGGKPVSVNLYAPAKETDAHTKARDAIAAYIPQLIAANE